MAILSDMLTLTPITVERMERYTNLLKKANSDVSFNLLKIILKKIFVINFKM